MKKPKDRIPISLRSVIAWVILSVSSFFCMLFLVFSLYDSIPTDNIQHPDSFIFFTKSGSQRVSALVFVSHRISSLLFINSSQNVSTNFLLSVTVSPNRLKFFMLNFFFKSSISLTTVSGLFSRNLVPWFSVATQKSQAKGHPLLVSTMRYRSLVNGNTYFSKGSKCHA